MILIVTGDLKLRSDHIVQHRSARYKLDDSVHGGRPRDNNNSNYKHCFSNVSGFRNLFTPHEKEMHGKDFNDVS